uniref:ABC transmembrane type-1 domain-containing protein n=1 Tax=Strigamia maritima TaxID=126957 RepID=T1ILX6_STRMM
MQKQMVIASDIWLYLTKNAILLWAWLLATFQHVSLWLAENVFTGKLSGENLLRYASTAVETVQHYTAIVYQWVNYQLGALTAG